MWKKNYFITITTKQNHNMNNSNEMIWNNTNTSDWIILILIIIQMESYLMILKERGDP